GAAARATASEGPGTSSACWTPLISAISLATWAALPTSVWMRMYAVTTSNDLLESCRRNGAHGCTGVERSAHGTRGPRACQERSTDRPARHFTRAQGWVCLPPLPGARWRYGSGGFSTGRRLGGVVRAG